MKHKRTVVYQIYPRSFKDSNNDGIGDLRGIIEKLDYLEYLGIDMIWLCPVYQSPNEDNGYDVSDYKDINPEFGTLDDMKELLTKAKEKGIGIMMDIVANHTSDQHMWFKEARTSRENPYHSFYVFKDANHGIPSDLQSIFLDSAWAYNEQTDEYYLHMFAKGQPDLNWHHEPVRESIYDILNYWIDLGVEGFRFDVIDLIAKELDQNIIGDGPKLHQYIREMSDRVFKGRNLLTVGETWGATVEKAKKYSNLDGSEFSMIFNFEHILLDQVENKEKWDLKPLSIIDLKQVFKRQQQGLYNVGWNSLFWNNHDLPRIVSRWGNDKEYRVESAKAFATLLHFMQGTPYIYQGEELGMTNTVINSTDDLRDIESFNMIKQRTALGYNYDEIMKSIRAKGRDNARTPMQWNNKQYAGFSKAEPWIGINPNYKEINVENQLGKDNSVLEYYRKLIKLRKNSKYSDIIEKATFDLMYEEHPSLFAYKRVYEEKEIIVLCNLSNREILIKNDIQFDEVIIHNYDDLELMTGMVLRPYEAIGLFATGQK